MWQSEKRLEDTGGKVILEIGEGGSHEYPVIDIVRDAKPEHENMLRYLRT